MPSDVTYADTTGPGGASAYDGIPFTSNQRTASARMRLSISDSGLAQGSPCTYAINTASGHLEASAPGADAVACSRLKLFKGRTATASVSAPALYGDPPLNSAIYMRAMEVVRV